MSPATSGSSATSAPSSLVSVATQSPNAVKRAGNPALQGWTRSVRARNGVPIHRPAAALPATYQDGLCGQISWPFQPLVQHIHAEAIAAHDIYIKD